MAIKKAFEQLTTTRDLAPFRNPSSVAVVGASDDQTKWGYWLARGALLGRSRRHVWLVNSRATKVHNELAYASVAELPEPPELVVLCVPPRFVEAVVVEALARGTKAFLGITAGVTNENRVVRLITEAGARIVGPNSLGLFDASSMLQLAWGNFTPGSIAVVSQSGQLGSEIANLAARAGLGISRFVSVGNQTDVNAAELLEDLIDHDATEIVALYLESFADGAHLVRTLRSLARAGKRTIMLTTGASDGSKRLAQSHTGSMTSTMDIVDAACRAAGAIRVSTPTQLVNVARYLSVASVPCGRRLAIVSDSGGQGGIAADVATAARLQVPAFSPSLAQQLSNILPAGASVSNPVDLAGAGESDLQTYAEISELLMASGEVDAVVLSGYLGCYGEDTPSIEAAELAVIDRLGDLAQSSGLPLLVHSMSSTSVAVARMWDRSIPSFGAIELLMETLGHVVGFSDWPGRDLKVPTRAVTANSSGYWNARRVVVEHGISVPNGVLVNSREDVRLAAGELRAPYVLKAGWLEHKSERDGVKLNLRDGDRLVAAYDEMLSRLGDGDYVVEEHDCRVDVVEMLVGARRDHDFGPTITVGAGGTQAELWRDVCTELAPVDRITAASMIQRLRSARLLDGWRGKPPVDIDALVSIVVGVSEAIAADTTITDFELNPIRVNPQGALAVDALITTTSRGHGHAID